MLKGTLRGTDEYLYPLVGVWLFAQASNFVTHIILRSLRPDDASTKREIPYGYGFNIITCPNYFFETVGWLTFCALTLDPFCKSSSSVKRVAQMIVWAKGKHRRYKQEFGDKYPRKRWVMLPGIL
ncbi:3-oxo-5a-steroid 4- dehydrogenase [Cystobasidiomycetes sp. EMM_F5]